ncbi:hypothetical protein Tco_0152423 [Tanacetum coccineum]
MLEKKTLYEFMKRRMELYMMKRTNGRMILASVEKEPLVLAFNHRGRRTMLKEYVEQLQLKPIFGRRIKLLNAGNGINKTKNVSGKLYDEFDKVHFKKRETLLEMFKSVKDLQLPLLNELHAYLQQHERHANEVRLMHERNSDPLALQQSEFSQPDSSLVVLVFQKGDDPIDAINHNYVPFGRQTTYAAGTTRKYIPGASGSNAGKQRTVICYNCKGKGSYDLISDELNSAKIAHMAITSRNGSDALTRYTKVIQDLLSHISRSCPSINNCGPQLIEVTPRKKDKKVRFAESLTSTENTKPESSPSKHKFLTTVLHSTGVRLSTSASGSQPSGNTKNDRILQTPSSNSKNKVEAHPRNVKSSLNKRNGTVKVNGSAVVQNLKKQDNSD